MTESRPAHPTWPLLVPDAQQPWQTVTSTPLAPPPRALVRDTVQTTAGDTLEYVYRPRGPRAVYVLPVTAAGEAVLIRQYRYPLRAYILEVPAGGLNDSEDVLAGAARELREEVGGVAGQWVPLPAFYPQPSISGVVFYAALALGVTLGRAAPEPDELLERLVLPLPEVYRRLEAGEVFDGPSSLTLFHARSVLQSRGLLG